MISAQTIWHRLTHLSRHDALVIALPLLILLAWVLWTAFKFMRPAPPHHFTIVTGASDGAYQIYAARYKEFFAKNGITLEIKASAGSAENLRRLLDPKEDVDVGFLQSGATLGQEVRGLVSLGILYPEPLWLFHRADLPVEDLGQLKGKRVAIGPEGSGTRLLALELLRAHGLDPVAERTSPLAGMAAAQALIDREVDVVFVVGSAQSSAVWAMFYTPGIEIFNFTQAEAYVRRFPYLSALTLPRGAIDFPRNIPNRDLSLVAPSATLVAREDLHPALSDLLLQAASATHGQAGLFQRAGQYPTANGVEIPLSREAERYYQSGKPFLQRYLPFWAATLINRLVFMLLPLLVVLVPLVRIVPFVYSWRVRRRIFRYYGELKFLEIQARDAPESKTQQEWLAEVDRIERAAHRIRTPLAFAHQVYMLRQHVQLVRKALQHQFGQAQK